MNFFFADDITVNNPSRPGVGVLVGIGGFHVSEENLNFLESELDERCREVGFPPVPLEGEFKWSPRRNVHWMRDHLVGDERRDFQIQVLEIAQQHDAEVRVIIEDCNYNCAIFGEEHDMSVTKMFMERVQRTLAEEEEHGLIIVDRPSGGRQDEDQFLTTCIDTIQNGTDYIVPSSVALNVLSSPSKFIRCLQLADLIVGCTVNYMAGEGRYTPPLFEHVKPMLSSQRNRIGGIGLKMYPDFRYANLYHWLLGDETWSQYNRQYKCRDSFNLPIGEKPYPTDPMVLRD